jgi:large subunit ribosomal protein L1
MVSEEELGSMIKEAKGSGKERKFTQSVELIMNFKDIDVKKGFQINETVQLPKTTSPARVCVIASGDMGIKAKSASADRVIDTDELSTFAENKRAARKFVNQYDFFLADTKMMPTVGKALGQILGPRGKMPTPVPFNAPIEAFLDRFRSSMRVRVRGSLSLSCRIGNETMDEAALTANAMAVIGAVEKKLPNGDKNMKRIMIKTTMGGAVKQKIQARRK